MALLGTLGVKLTADTTGFTTGMQQVGQQVNGFRDQIGTMTKAAAAGFAALSGTIGVAIRALGEQQQAEQRLAAVAGLQNIDTQKIIDYASALQQVTTFGDEATISATAMLASFNLTEDQLIALMPRMQNMAAFLGTDMNQAALSMGKAIATSADALKRQGIIMSDAEKAAFDAADQMGRVAMLADLIDKNVGDAAQRMAQTVTGSFDQMRGAVGDALESIGRVVEGPLTTAFQTAKAAIMAFSGFLDGLSAETRQIAGIVTIATTAFLGLAAAGGAVALAFAPAVAAIGAIAAPLLIVGAAIGGVILILGRMKRAWGVDLNDIGKMVKDWAGSVVDFFKSMFETVMGFLAEFINEWKDFLGIEGRFEAPTIDFEFETEGIDVLNKAGKAVSNTFIDLKDDFVAGIGVIGDFLEGTIGTTESLKDVTAESDKALTKIRDLAGAAGEAAEATRTNTQAEREAVTAAPPVPAPADTGLSVLGDAASQAGQQMQTIGNQISQDLIGGLGTVGSVIQSGMQGFAAGGPFGALIAVIADLLSRTKGFAETVEALNSQLGMLIDALGPFTEAGAVATEMMTDILKPMLDAMKEAFQVLSNTGLKPLTKAVTSIFKAISPLITVFLTLLRPVLGVFGFALRVLAEVIVFVSTIIGEIVNAIIEAVASILDFIAGIADIVGAGGEVRDFADEIRDAKVDINSLRDSLKEPLPTPPEPPVPPEQKQEQAEATESMKGLNTAAKQTAETFRQATGALVNVPAGFKVAAARFAAISTGVEAGAGAVAAGAPMTRTVQIEALYLAAENPEDFLRKLQAASEWNEFTTTGTPIRTSPSPYAR